MKKKTLYVLIGSIIVLLVIGIVCFIAIPRIDYNYDKNKDCYYVNKVYGNAKEYEILDEIKGKKVSYIGSRAFADKTRLETIIMGSNITKIERLAFSNCYELKNVDLSKVLIIERNAFMDCISLESVELGAIDILGGAFYDCKNLKSVTMNEVESIGSYAFSGTSIEEIILPETVNLIGKDAFYNCGKLNQIICYSVQMRINEYLLSLGELVIFM